MLYMLDTDISSYIIRGGYGPIEKRLKSHLLADLCISVMTRAELLYGLKKLPPVHALHLAVMRYVQVTPAAPWDAAAADVHAELRYQLRSAGTPIGDMDTLIAAHAISLNATLVTNNTRHYRPIKLPILLDNW